jgi:glycosyltransferase involved in cell wall biosynthesis
LIDLTSPPEVSIIMSVRDAAETLNAALRSILWQTFTDWELILIDDGSRDDAVPRVAARADPRIRITCHGESRGLAYRLNEGIDVARGRFIARMDADDVCYPQRLAIQAEFLRGNPAVDVLATQAIVFRRDGEIVAATRSPTTHEQITANPYRRVPFFHPTWCGKAEWFRKFRYDPRFKRGQDQELLLRAWRSSRFAAVDKILLGYRDERTNLYNNNYGRILYTYAVWADARRSKAYSAAVRETALQIAKCVVELGAAAVGQEEWLLRRKLEQVTSLEAEEWRTIWSRLTRGEVSVDA